MKRRRMLTMLVLALGLMVCLTQVGKAVPMGTAWTYQGRLMDANGPADGLYDFMFDLYDANVGGTHQGPMIDINDLDVIDGYFTVLLDFGSDVFNGDARWLEIGVRPGDSNDPNDFVVLSPRQEITPTPYALQTRGIFVDNVLNVGIGTTSPVGKLHVDGGKAMDGTLGADVVIKAQDGGDGWAMQNNGEAGGDIILLPGEGGEEYGVGFPGPDGKVGIGTTTPISSLEVISPIDTHAIRATSNYIPIYAIRTPPTGTWPAVQGDCNSLYNGASAIRGKILSTTPGSLSAGVYGYNSGEGTNGVGVRGHHVGSGTGVYGQCDNGFGGYFVGAKNYFGGNVGIGTTTPDTKLEIDGGNNPSGLKVSWGSDYGNLYGEFKHAGSGGLIINANAGGGWADMSLQTDGTTRMFIERGGNIGIGTTGNPPERLTVRGNILVQSVSTGASVAEIGEGLDYAEGFDVTEVSDIEAGTVLVIDSDNPGKLTVSRSAYDSKVAGIVAGAKGLGSGVRLGIGQFDYDVALAGRVYCNVDATKEAVQAGDLLTTSATPGYAMKATDYDRARGAILGKAMQKLQQGQKGQILVLVTLQ